MENNYSKKCVLFSILLLTLLAPTGYTQIYIEPNSLDISVIEGTSLSTQITVTNDTNSILVAQIQNIFGPGIDNNSVQSNYYPAISTLYQTNASQINQVPSNPLQGIRNNSSINKNIQKTKILLPLGKEHKQDEILVRFKPLDNGKTRSNLKKKKLLAHLGNVKIERAYHIVPGLNAIKLPTGFNAKNAIEKFKNNPEILYVQPNYKLKANTLDIPNDPAFDVQWALHNTGQTEGTADADIDAPETWQRLNTIPYQPVLVAVIDSGVEYKHPDIADNMWINNDEIPDNGVDDDNNGYVDDIYGYDFINNDPDPNDDHYHGSHCAGVIAAVTNNNEGIASVAGKQNHVKIMALKFLDSNGEGWTDDAVDALQYSLMMGAKISNNSYGGPDFDLALNNAIDAADDADALFVAAAGNDYGQNNDYTPHYPSSYSNNAVIAVMASDNYDDVAYFSNYGPTSVDLAAPGVNIVSLNLKKTYKYANGTSMATPHVAGACAIMRGINPKLNNIWVKSVITNSVDTTLPGYCTSGGRLNLYNAIYNTPNPMIDISPVIVILTQQNPADVNVTVDAVGYNPNTIDTQIVVLPSLDLDQIIVPVRINIVADDLQLNTHQNFTATGEPGGPFYPDSFYYLITNQGPNSTDWQILETPQSWLSVNPLAGSLEQNDSQSINISFTPDALTLEPGTYTQTLTFKNLFSGSIKTRTFTLKVRPINAITQSFDSGTDNLSYKAVTFTPNGSKQFYWACSTTAQQFPTDPNGSVHLALALDDFAQVPLPDGNDFTFFDQTYDSIFISSHGYITFGEGDITYNPTFENHFALPRISAFFTDLAPDANSSVSYKILPDRIAVTYQNIPIYGSRLLRSSFQTELFFTPDQKIKVTWLNMADTFAIVGLSDGNGTPQSFIKSDFTATPPCSVQSDLNFDYIVNFPDYALLSKYWQTPDCNFPQWCEHADFDFSGAVDSNDLNILSAYWLNNY